jgi:hypothetical protein
MNGARSFVVGSIMGALSTTTPPVCTENLGSGVAVVKPAKYRVRTDASDSLNRTRNRRILVQGSMRSEVIIIVGVRFQNSAQIRLAQDNDLVHHSRRIDPISRSAKAFCQGDWCNGPIPDAHGAQSARDDAAIDPVAIADEVVWSLIPWKCFRYLTCNPFGRGICCDVDPDEVSAVQPDDDEGIE